MEETTKEIIMKNENGCRKRLILWFIKNKVTELEILYEFENYEGLWEVEEEVSLDQKEILNLYKFLSNYI